MNWFEEADKSSAAILEKIYNHPFIQDLQSGTLDRDIFQYYMEQDAVYLKGFAKVLQKIAENLPNKKDTFSYAKFSENAIAAEQSLHSNYITHKEIQAQPACHHYLLFLQHHLSQLENALAAVLPCFVVYEKVGNYILKHTDLEGHPYASWIQLYGGKEFSLSVQEAIRLTNQYAHLNGSMKEIYLQGCELEYLFWDGAYKKLRWIKTS